VLPLVVATADHQALLAQMSTSTAIGWRGNRRLRLAPSKLAERPAQVISSHIIASRPSSAPNDEANRRNLNRMADLASMIQPSGVLCHAANLPLPTGPTCQRDTYLSRLRRHQHAHRNY